MLPPPSSGLLEANPNFAKLYKHLTENVLARNGSTRSKIDAAEVTGTKLKEARVTAIREDMLLKALEETSYDGLGSSTAEKSEPNDTFTNAPSSSQNLRASDLPPEVRDVVYDIATYLSVSLDDTSEPLAADTDELMAPEIATFRQHLPIISKVLSAHLVDTESSLTELVRRLSAKPSQNALGRENSTDTLSSSILSSSSVVSTLSNTTLPTCLSRTSSSLSAALSQHADTLASTIRHLELTIHGSQSRHLTSRAAYLASVCRGIQLKSQLLALEREKAVYGNPEMMEWLDDEMQRLNEEERRLEKIERELEDLLGEYETEGRRPAGQNGNAGHIRGAGSGEDVFRILGQRYAEVEAEIEDVKRDIERLEVRAWRGR